MNNINAQHTFWYKLGAKLYSITFNCLVTSLMIKSRKTKQAQIYLV